MFMQSLYMEAAISRPSPALIGCALNMPDCRAAYLINLTNGDSFACIKTYACM